MHLQVADGLTHNLLPKLPGDSIQKQFVGSSGRPSLREGFNFYMVCKAQAKSCGVKIGPDTKVLDFGVGWGRMLRFWLKDVESKNLWGVDVDPEMVALCRELFGCCNFATVEAHPPSHFESSEFSVIYAYSVFSHLSEDTAKQWITELSRIMEPGGILVATTHSRRFIKFCDLNRAKPPETTWHAWLQPAFLDTEACLKAYDQGQFLYHPTGGGKYRDASFYGDALFSRKYVEENYCEHLLLREFVDDQSYLPQAMMVLQKLAGAGHCGATGAVSLRSSHPPFPDNAETVENAKEDPPRICNICGSTIFGAGPNGRMAENGMPPQCEGCQSLERHRASRELMVKLREPLDFSRLRALQFGRDRTVEHWWFKSVELSISGEHNSLDLQAIDRPSGSYDLIICNHVLEHIPDDSKALMEMVRITSERGFIFLTVPTPHRLTTTTEWGYPDKPHGHYRIYGKDIVERVQRFVPHIIVIQTPICDPVTGVPDIAFLLTRAEDTAKQLRALLEEAQ